MKQCLASPKTTSRVAVIMSTYRNDKLPFLQSAIESILDQDYKNVHLFLMIDGVLEPSVENYLSTLASQKISIVRNPVCRGLAVSLNALIDCAATGNYEYYARMDADDISRVDRITKQVDYLNAHPEIDVLGSWCREIDHLGNSVGVLRKPEHQTMLRAAMPVCSPFIHSSVMFRSRVFATHRYPTDQFLSEDFGLWLQLQKDSFVFGNIQAPLVDYRRDVEFSLRRSQWPRILAESRLRLKCLTLSGAFTLGNVVGVIARIGAHCVLRIAPKVLVSPILSMYRRFVNGRSFSPAAQETIPWEE